MPSFSPDPCPLHSRGEPERNPVGKSGPQNEQEIARNVVQWPEREPVRGGDDGIGDALRAVVLGEPHGEDLVRVGVPGELNQNTLSMRNNTGLRPQKSTDVSTNVASVIAQNRRRITAREQNGRGKWKLQGAKPSKPKSIHVHQNGAPTSTRRVSDTSFVQDMGCE